MFSSSLPVSPTPLLGADCSESLATHLTAFLIGFLIDKLNTNIGFGLDKVPTLFQVNCKKYTSLPLCMLSIKGCEEYFLCQLVSYLTLLLLF